ncbi:hypothetical protein AABH71_001787 [Salmonella enterica]|uniref:hypothetical protein n=1 Tax=Salmonella enterica TaxID=28901 RepID=UPI0012F46814|nr:hypothetical protein [Salmonella enterica]EBQ9004458.1 hypothetical protein [Salmonella enterica subsp. enterica serovar Blockley]HBM0094844.1 hypothetical protein [Salmonella enterica subsp. enterica serovar Blitta]ECW2124523.1 hypothetical protein [Salmonella enterica]EEY2695524.1 hypothetical protein [Salmonella enterica]
MTTRKIIVTNDPQKITDGNTTAVLQFNGSILLCDSSTKPASDAPAIHFPENYRYRIITVTPPTVAWVWTTVTGKNVEIVIL